MIKLIMIRYEIFSVMEKEKQRKEGNSGSSSSIMKIEVIYDSLAEVVISSLWQRYFD